VNSCARINREISSRRSAEHVAAVCAKRLPDLDEINLSTALHRIAKLGARKEILHNDHFHLILARAFESTDDLQSQSLSNFVWSLATIKIADAPFLNSIASAAIRRRTEFGAQALSNTAWAFATLKFTDAPLLDSISA